MCGYHRQMEIPVWQMKEGPSLTLKSLGKLWWQRSARQVRTQWQSPAEGSQTQATPVCTWEGGSRAMASGPWARKRFTSLIDSRLEQITRKFENRGRWTRLEIVVHGVGGMPGGKIWPGLHSASCLPDMSCSIFQPPSWTETTSKVNCFPSSFSQWLFCHRYMKATTQSPSS